MGTICRPHIPVVFYKGGEIMTGRFGELCDEGGNTNFWSVIKCTWTVENY